VKRAVEQSSQFAGSGLAALIARIRKYQLHMLCLRATIRAAKALQQRRPHLPGRAEIAEQPMREGKESLP
jgi:hypothetical protein